MTRQYNGARQPEDAAKRTELRPGHTLYDATMANVFVNL